MATTQFVEHLRCLWVKHAKEQQQREEYKKILRIPQAGDRYATSAMLCKEIYAQQEAIQHNANMRSCAVGYGHQGQHRLWLAQLSRAVLRCIKTR